MALNNLKAKLEAVHGVLIRFEYAVLKVFQFLNPVTDSYFTRFLIIKCTALGKNQHN